MNKNAAFKIYTITRDVMTCLICLTIAAACFAVPVTFVILNRNPQNYTCNGKNVTDPTVCLGRGNCTGINSCTCFGYTGLNCQTVACNGIAYTDATVCNSRGNCTASDTCSCKTGFSGQFCQTKN
eukprot:gene6327-10334_t